MFRLTREPELRYSQSGTALCKVGLAASEKYGDKETQLFIDGTAFKKTAEMLNTVQKGHRILVTGKINTDSWQDQQGQNRSKTVMTIESFEFVEKRDSNAQSHVNQQQGYQAPQQDYQQPQQHREQPQQDYKAQQPIPDIDEDEIPF